MQSSVRHAPTGLETATDFWRNHGGKVIGVAALLLVGWIGYLLFDLDSFYVYGADIQGNRILSAQEIYAASDIHSMSVFWVNPGDVAASVESLPNVKSASVKVSLPANVRILVEERQPEVVWQTGESTWWIDNEGMFVPPKADADANQNRLRIVDDDGRPVNAEDQVNLAIIRSAQIVNQRKPEVTELHYTDHYGLAYLTPEGWPIFLGKTGDIPAKLLVADSVRTDLLARGVIPAFIDVRNPLRAVYQEQEVAPQF